MDALMTELQSELEAREHATVTSVTPGQPVKRHFKEPHTAAALMSTASGPVCSYCQQAHVPGQCDTVTQLEAQRQILRKSGRCYNCLKRGHI